MLRHQPSTEENNEHARSDYTVLCRPARRRFLHPLRPGHVLAISNPDRDRGRGDPRNHAIIRGHGNFTEYVPIALTLLLVLEMNGAPRAWCHGFGGSLLAARLFHGWGMRRSTGVTLGRRVGAGLTFTVILAMSGLCLIRPF